MKMQKWEASEEPLMAGQQDASIVKMRARFIGGREMIQRLPVIFSKKAELCGLNYKSYVVYETIESKTLQKSQPPPELRSTTCGGISRSGVITTPRRRRTIQFGEDSNLGQELGVPSGRALGLPGPEEPPVRLRGKDIDLLLKILRDVLPEPVILLEGIEGVFAFGAGPVGSWRETVFVVEAGAFVAAVDVLGAIG